MRTSLGIVGLLLCVIRSQAAVDLAWRLETPAPWVGDTVRVGLYAVSDTGSDETFSTIEAVLWWNEEYLALLGNDNDGPYAWLFSGFPDDSGLDGLNNTYTDGNAYYNAWGNFSAPPVATPAGLLVTTLEFEAVASAPAAKLMLLAEYGDYSVTAVYDDEVPGLNIVGRLGIIQIEIRDTVCRGDTNCDGQIDFADVNTFVDAIMYGLYCDGIGANADVDANGGVGFEDINPFVALLMDNPLPILCP